MRRSTNIAVFEMAPHLEVLLKGDDWKLPLQHRSRQSERISTRGDSSSRLATVRFSELAKAHGSVVTWLPETGYLVTKDPHEAAKNFPYEDWRDQALKETGLI